jgi:hypothetical protein
MLMAKALDQFKKVQGSIFVPTMLTSVCIMTYNTIMVHMVIYMIIQFVYKPYVYNI